MTNIQHKALDLLNCSQFITIVSITENGYPRACAVAKLANRDWTVYVATGTSGNKVRQFMQNPRASISCFKIGGSVTLIGTVQLVEDRAEKAAMWQDWLFNHFPQGVDDPEYTLLKFTPHEGTFCIGEDFATEKI